MSDAVDSAGRDAAAEPAVSVASPRPAANNGSADNEPVDAPTVGQRRERWTLLACLLVVNLPIVMGTVRALQRGWQPLSDSGILLVRARDVATEHHPLLGSWTSASVVVGKDLNNPGPLYFDALAPVVRLLGPWVGLAVGVMLVNIAASSLAVVAARRINVESMAAVVIVVAGLQYTMGSELLFDVWQPNALVLPFFAFLVVVAALACGDAVMLPWAVGVGSLIVQTHMSHTVLVAVLTVAGVLVGALASRRAGSPGWRRPLVWSTGVAVLAWCQPVLEQFTSPGDGNLARILNGATSGDADPIGWTRATRLLAEVEIMGPWFQRDSYTDAVPVMPESSAGPRALPGVVSGENAIIVLCLVTVVLALACAWAWRSGRPRLATLLGTATFAQLLAWVVLATSPVSVIGLSAHQVRWLWPVAALAFAAVLAVVVTVLPSAIPSRATARGVVVAAAIVVGAAVAAANLPPHVAWTHGPVAYIPYQGAARQLVGDMDVLEGRGTILYDSSTLRYAEAYSGRTFAELQDRGIPFVFDDEVLIRQMGEGRRNDGSARWRLWQVEGPEAATVPVGATRVGFAEGPSGLVALFVEPIYHAEAADAGDPPERADG